MELSKYIVVMSSGKRKKNANSKGNDYDKEDFSKFIGKKH
jgi:hypothetical protein